MEEQHACLITLIGRQSDGLELCTSMESWGETPKGREYHQKGRKLLTKLSTLPPQKRVIEDPPYYYCCVAENGVIYLTLCSLQYPKRMAVAFLIEIAKEFDLHYGTSVPRANRPYEFIKFDTFIQKTKKMYHDCQPHRNLNNVTQELIQVQKIMSESLDAMLSRGEILSSVSRKSDDLLHKSSLFQTKAKELNLNMFLRKYGLIVALILTFSLVFYVWW
jgi:vesicle transport protein SEC22